MRSIIALGLRGDCSAADALVTCALRTPTDVVEGLEIVRSLRAILSHSGEMEPLKHLAESHPAHAVRMAAIGALARIV